MADVVSIELVLDDATDARVRADWRALADAGMSSLGAHTSPSNRPHLTLLARPTLDAPRAAFARAAATLPVSVTLAEPVVFAHGDRGVLAWRVEPSDELRALHTAVHTAAGSGEDLPHTAAADWTPHVSLARRLRLDALPDALALIGPPIAGTGTTLRRWDAASATITVLR
ncbi:2'-5' RNA ligase family protein [Microbacterium sp. NPDC064584]|uniref:2'-5' RNA ligase family protein n=1 Tax=Microbacterium sp. NPDC064584 TaxID=3155817 RepID=UPI00343F3538